MFLIILGKLFESFKFEKIKLGISLRIILSTDLKQVWASTRCKDSVPAEANVWVCYVCLPGDCEDHFGQREPSFRM